MYDLVVYVSDGMAVEPIVTNGGGWFSYVVLPYGESSMGDCDHEAVMSESYMLPDEGPVCPRCDILIRPAGGHLCGDCGRDI
ncbi:MAG TPA: hypothetical protein VH593_17035 [Ktedonobacteraceae bacterium]|jgi:hypothetical protein